MPTAPVFSEDCAPWGALYTCMSHKPLLQSHCTRDTVGKTLATWDTALGSGTQVGPQSGPTHLVQPVELQGLVAKVKAKRENLPKKGEAVAAPACAREWQLLPVQGGAFPSPTQGG